MKKKTYSRPVLHSWSTGTQHSFAFNPLSNPDLPSNPDTPGVGVKQEWDMSEEIWQTDDLE